MPQPGKGQWAPTTLALLHYNRDLCDTIAGRVRERWASLGDNGQGEKAIRDFVLNSSLSDLAAARAAADMAQSLLTGAREEAGQETGASLTRLAELGTSLCDTVALPTAPRKSFEDQIAGLLGRIDRESTELGRLLVVPQSTLDAALEPYLVPIQIAGIEAEGQYLDYLESIRPKPQPPTQAELMAAWHKGYAAKTEGVKRALGIFLAARQQNDSGQIRASCRQITAQIIPILRDKAMFKTPDPELDIPLREAYEEIRELANHCSAARFREVDKQIGRVQTYLGLSAQILGRYSLTP